MRVDPLFEIEARSFDQLPNPVRYQDQEVSQAVSLSHLVKEI